MFAGSKKFSDTESRHALIEVETLGVVWSLEKARMFTLVCPSLLVSVDHLPFLAILGDRSLEDIPHMRLYRLKRSVSGSDLQSKASHD